jgi:serine/threonine-protein kinase
MANTTIPSFVDSLRQLQLLDRPHFEEVARLQATFSDARLLARELLQRGWLSAYQLNQLFQGRGRELVLGQYVVVERLGEGGMGTVFKARHRRLDRIDALKVIRKDHLANATAVQRFHQEARLAARVSHVNIVSIYDASEADGMHFLAMEYVDGIDLAKLVQRNGPLPIAQACEFIRQAALGLEHAHECGLVHRDIKPSNLFVNPKKGLVKVLDMGLARMLKAAHEGDEAGGLTHTGVVMGTPDYISPEQAINSSQVDIRSDIYSLGCTLYFLLTGQVPYPGGSLTEKLLRRQLEDGRPVNELRPEVPGELAAIVAGMMARKPDDRYATPGEVAEALEPFCQGAHAAPAPRRRSGVTLPTTGGAGSTASMVKATVNTALDPNRAPTIPVATPVTGEHPSPLRSLVGTAFRQASAGFGRLSTRGRLIVGGSVFAVSCLLVLTMGLLVRSAFRGTPAVAQPTTAAPVTSTQPS